MAQSKKERSSQPTFTHLIVTALVMLVVGYLFGRFSGGVQMGGAQALPQGSPAVSNAGSIAALVTAAEESPDNADVWTALGNAYFDTGQNAQAIEAYSRSLDIDDTDPNVWTDRGIMYRRIGNPQQAIRDFDTAAELDPTHQMSRFNRGIVLYYDLNDPAAAKASFQEVLRLSPNFATPSGVYLKDFMDTLD